MLMALRVTFRELTALQALEANQNQLTSLPESFAAVVNLQR